ncbi:uncharacterized protein LOC119726989 [Patiria miniata]|uniref:Uncharacterized protein n=1 Tax=Patiria miniata TaxID=46514 RepID=A0A913ZTL0_PATMI|nr:uncharacterized protein LOC119726989 [Patiria miniata]
MIFMYLDDWLIVAKSEGQTAQNLGNVYVDDEARLHHQREEVPPNPVPGNHFPGSRDRSTQGHSRPHRGTCYQPAEVPQTFPIRSSRSSASLAETSRVHGQLSGPGSMVQTEDASFANASSGTLQTKDRSNLSIGLDRQSHSATPSVVVIGTEHSVRTELPQRGSSRHNLHRRLQRGLGSLPSPSTSCRHLGRQHSVPTYQCSRTPGCSQCPTPLSSRRSGPVCSNQDRQHDSGSIYQQKQGGTRSPQLCYRTWEMFQWLLRHKVDLLAIHIPGAENDIADSLSRGKVVPTEWSLNRRIVSQIFSILGRPHIDLFASAINTQLPVFCSRAHQPHAWASDALSIDWTNMFAYAFPPISILTKVIGKLERDRCKILLIAPFWPRQPWFPRLVRLLVGSPLILPDRHDLLVQPQSRFRHPSPGDLHLACWPLSSVLTEQQVFLKTLQPWPQRDVVSQHDESMTVDYDIIVGGAQNRLWIRSVLL